MADESAHFLGVCDCEPAIKAVVAGPIQGVKPVPSLATGAVRPATVTALRCLVVGLISAGVAGCSAGGAVTVVSPAPSASDPACVRAVAALPDTVLGRPRTPLAVDGAAAWGEPAIVLRCGLPELGPTRKDCQTVDDVDWVVDVSADPTTITTYGRSPAVEVRIPRSYGPTSGSDAAVDLAAVARALPKSARSCVG